MQKLGLFGAATVGALAYECAELPASSIEVATFAPERNRSRPFATVVRVEKKRVVVALASRKEMVLDLRRPNCFDVASLRQIEVTRATRYEASEPEHRKECPYCPMDCVCDFQCARRRQGRRSEEELRFANRNWIQGDDLNRTLSIRGNGGGEGA